MGATSTPADEAATASTPNLHGNPLVFHALPSDLFSDRVIVGICAGLAAVNWSGVAVPLLSSPCILARLFSCSSPAAHFNLQTLHGWH